MATDSATTPDPMKYCLSHHHTRTVKEPTLRTWLTGCVKVSWISKPCFLLRLSYSGWHSPSLNT